MKKVFRLVLSLMMVFSLGWVASVNFVFAEEPEADESEEVVEAAEAEETKESSETYEMKEFKEETVLDETEEIEEVPEEEGTDEGTSTADESDEDLSEELDDYGISTYSLTESSIVFNWADDGLSCTATYEADGETITTDCVVQVLDETVTCSNGTREVLASFEYDGKTYSYHNIVDYYADGKGHSVTKTEAKEPTETKAGNIEYWYCSLCKSYFTNESLLDEYKVSFEDIMIPSLDSSIIAQGTSGTNFWTLNSDYTLTISGTGSVSNVMNTLNPILDKITAVVIEEGITVIPTGTFWGLTNCKSVTIPASVKSIGTAAFYTCDSLETVYYNGNEEQFKNIDIDNYSFSLHASDPFTESYIYYYGEYGDSEYYTYALDGTKLTTPVNFIFNNSSSKKESVSVVTDLTDDGTAKASDAKTTSSSSTEDTETEGTSPKTADTTVYSYYIVLLTASLVGLVALKYRKEN